MRGMPVGHGGGGEQNDKKKIKKILWRDGKFGGQAGPGA